VDSLVGCFLLVRREALERAGGFDEDYFIYSEEVDLCRRIRDLGYGIFFVPAAGAVHHGWGSSSRAPLRFELEQKWSVLQYWEKNHGKRRLLAYAAISVARLAVRIAASSVRHAVDPSIRGDTRRRMSTDMKCIRLTLGYLAGRGKSGYIGEAVSGG
jgi:GT2 family glycosyltransferase